MTTGILLWGLFATLLLSTLLSAGQALGLSRMSIPFMLGTMLTPDRDQAPVLGFAVHLGMGWLFTGVYALTFWLLGFASWWLGALLGLAHSVVVLTVLMPLIPGLHPRMASESHGPDPTRSLEPPGFMALNYGRGTPAMAIVAHLFFGTLLGLLFSLSTGV